MLTARETSLPGVLLLEPKVHRDGRGAFMETWNLRRHAEHGVGLTFVQDNLSRSTYGVLRGLHLQHPHAQGKLVQVLVGEVWDVAVDLRRGSPHFGAWTAASLSADNARQLWVPPGFHHGFCVTSAEAVFTYKCTDYYAPDDEVGVAWNDPDIGIAWPIERPVLSEKDKAAPRLAELAHRRLPSIDDYPEG